MAPASQHLLALLALGLLWSPQHVNAHGYIKTPPSRQASCAADKVDESNCGGVTYEPQSVESPKGAPFDTDVGTQICNGGGSRFSELNTPGADIWPTTSIPAAQDLALEWKITTAHKTQSWAYYITKADTPLDPSQPLTKDSFETEPILLLDTNHDAPPPSLTHTVPGDALAGRSGYAVIYGVWSIGDTGNAFYNCVDVNFEASEAEQPASNTTTTTAAPTTMATSTRAMTGTAVTGTGLPGTAVSATGSMSTATGAASVGYSATGNSTVLTLSGRKLRKYF